MLFVYAPSTKSCEPPAGIARLVGAFKHHGLPVDTLDMNLEGFYDLYTRDLDPLDSWSRRALKRRDTNLELLKSKAGYSNVDRYRNAVMDLSKVLKLASEPSGVQVSLANYLSDDLSPVNCMDLIHAAENPEENIFYPCFKRRFEEIAQKNGGLETVGFSLNFLNQALCTFAMIGYVRKRFKGVRVVLGGGLITSWMRMPEWTSPFGDLVDVMIAGEGEKQLLEMHGVDDIKSNYTPDYSLFRKKDYLAPGFILPYCTSGGCYWRKCTFCPERAEKNPYLPIPVTDAVTQLHELSEENNPSMVHIVDNAVSPAFMKKLADSGFSRPWYAFSRVTRHLADPEYCKALKKSGCRMLKLGLESGDSKVLKDMNKGVELSLVSRVLTCLKNAGIKTYVYLLFGTPSETEEAARKTMEFTVSHSDKIGFLNLAVFNLPYFAPEVRNLQTRQFYEGDLSLYREFVHPMGWHRGKIRAFLDKEFKKDPGISEIIKRDPVVFNSNHAAFF